MVLPVLDGNSQKLVVQVAWSLRAFFLHLESAISTLRRPSCIF